MAADGNSFEEFQLEPFIHQVGGQSSILQLDDTTICKYLNLQELNFYTSIPDQLKALVPDFKGVVEVNFTEDSDGFLMLTAHPSDKFILNSHLQTLQQNRSEKKTKCRIRVNHTGNIEIVNELEEQEQIFEEGDQTDGTVRSSHNPWALRCHRKQFKKLKANSSSIAFSNHEFIVLENLTYNYTYPCILDLKMGTRQFGDDASLVKQQTHEAKVASTTSKALGIRLCGMQVYHLKSGHFICHNKYYGRGLSVEGFKRALQHYLHNGQRLCREVIPPLVNKLHNICETIRQLETFRFYSCSLLVLYDGKDVLHSPLRDTNGTDIPTENENANVIADKTEENRNTVKYKSNASKDSQSATIQEKNVKVDIRLIDFAHSTHHNMPGVTVRHRGPDEGLIFGLENLIAELKSIEKEHCL
ncbi:inositol hexakisphosphate kinase 1-like isoform X2 [Centruroides vittatus]|uniref:inositol hexakisphosphate kinase 1-like isoform X2 n=1 Tax=Centruroides vittatus TaxID=120091 RepID=UPI00350F2A0E